jgi:hypothetical protein
VSQATFALFTRLFAFFTLASMPSTIATTRQEWKALENYRLIATSYCAMNLAMVLLVQNARAAFGSLETHLAGQPFPPPPEASLARIVIATRNSLVQASPGSFLDARDLRVGLVSSLGVRQVASVAGALMKLWLLNLFFPRALKLSRAQEIIVRLQELRLRF